MLGMLTNLLVSNPVWSLVFLYVFVNRVCLALVFGVNYHFKDVITVNNLER